MVRLNSTDCRIQSDHSKCDQVSLKWSYEMLKSGLFPKSKKHIHTFFLRRYYCFSSDVGFTFYLSHCSSSSNFHYSIQKLPIKLRHMPSQGKRRVTISTIFSATLS